MLQQEHITIDFETFSEQKLKVVGAARYAVDKSTEILCLGYSINQARPELWVPGMTRPRTLFEAIRDGLLVNAFNTFFEYCIWRFVAIPEFGWPIVPFNSWRDTQATCLMYALPASLEEVGDELHLNTRKDKRGTYLINKLCKPRRPSKANPATRWLPTTAPADFDDLYEYCRQDVRAEIAVENAIPTMHERELNVWRLTMRQNIRGVPVDLDLAQNVVRVMKGHTAALNDRIKKLTDGEIQTGGQLEKIKEWCSDRGTELNDMTADTVELYLRLDSTTPEVKQMLQLRQGLSKTSVKKLNKIIVAICPDGRLHGCLRYHKASTGRWGGALLQPQNLPREAVKDVELAVEAFALLSYDDIDFLFGEVDVLSTAMIRPAVCAPDGMMLFDGDYSSIENCTVMWLADDQDGLRLLRGGLDLYIDMATDLHPGVSYDEIANNYETDKTMYKYRRHGKLTILGAVYMMGSNKFMLTCQEQKFPITKRESDETIQTFRNKYRSIVKLWYGLEECAINATLDRGRKFTYKRLSFVANSEFLFMILPNGKRLAYHQPKVEMVRTPWGKMKEAVTHGGYNKRGKWDRLTLSPGRLTENASQATAREVLVDGLFSLENAGYKTILSVHDEPLALMPEGQGTLEEFISLMCEVSPAFKSLPLKANGFVGRRFKK